MTKLAVKNSDWIKWVKNFSICSLGLQLWIIIITWCIRGSLSFRVDPWECHQETWLQTKKVLDHYQEVVSSDTEGQAKVKLLCGADLLESFATPGLWAPQDVRSLWNNIIITILICCEKRDHFGYEAKSIFYHGNLQLFTKLMVYLYQWISTNIIIIILL